MEVLLQVAVSHRPSDVVWIWVRVLTLFPCALLDRLEKHSYNLIFKVFPGFDSKLRNDRSCDLLKAQPTQLGLELSSLTSTTVLAHGCVGTASLFLVEW